MAFHVIIVIYS